MLNKLGFLLNWIQTTVSNMWPPASGNSSLYSGTKSRQAERALGAGGPPDLWRGHSSGIRSAISHTEALWWPISKAWNVSKYETTTHSSTLAWEIPLAEEPGRLQSLGSQRVGHDWVTEPTHTLSMNAGVEMRAATPNGSIRRRAQWKTY